ncbi:MAG: hypothetical protein IJE81_03165 [Oscillospiraceae bacterium]|nr:hypothetical protein [Oscillospiraceae bacterium]
MSETGRGYSLPYAVDRGVRIGTIIVMSICTVASGLLFVWMIRPQIWYDWLICFLPVLLMLVLFSSNVLELFAVLHIVPEGIAITLFGKTLRRFPAEQIRFLTAIPGNAANDRVNRIAVCDKTLEELTQLGYKTTPRFMRIAKPRWPGEFAESYLYHRSMTVPGEMNFMRKILWLDWAPERLQLLRQMYPDAQWLDCTQKQIFETQLRNAEGEKHGQ